VSDWLSSASLPHHNHGNHDDDQNCDTSYHDSNNISGSSCRASCCSNKIGVLQRKENVPIFKNNFQTYIFTLKGLKEKPCKPW
jgi:hypothetical protein